MVTSMSRSLSHAVVNLTLHVSVSFTLLLLCCSPSSSLSLTHTLLLADQLKRKVSLVVHQALSNPAFITRVTFQLGVMLHWAITFKRLSSTASKARVRERLDRDHEGEKGREGGSEGYSERGIKAWHYLQVTPHEEVRTVCVRPQLKEEERKLGGESPSKSACVSINSVFGPSPPSAGVGQRPLTLFHVRETSNEISLCHGMKERAVSICNSLDKCN